MAAPMIMSSLRAVVQWWLNTPAAAARYTGPELIDRWIDQLGTGVTRPS
jgi:hypothetical protein